MIKTTNKKMLTLGLHFLPSIVFTSILFSLMPLIAKTTADLFLIQIILVTVFLLGLEILIPQLYCQYVEKRSFWFSLKQVKAIEISWKAFGIAIA